MSLPPALKSVFGIFQKQPSEDNFTFFLEKGNYYWEARNFKKALKYFNLAIESNPDDERPWNNKGIVLRNLGQIDEAREAFETALKLSSGNRTIRSNLESLKKPIASGTPSIGFGLSDKAAGIFPMLKYEIPRVMITAVVMVSAILFLTLFLITVNSESLLVDNFQYLTLSLTTICLIIILIALFSQLHYLIQIVQYEIKEFLFYLLGAVIIMIVPLHETLGVGQTGNLFSYGNIGLFIIGSAFIAIGFFYAYIKGSYFLPWLIGVIIFMFASFHEFFRFLIFNEIFGIYDMATAKIGIILTFIGLFLFLNRKIVNMLLNKSEELRRDEKYDEAMRYQNLILRLNPYNEVAWNDKGNVLYTTGDIEGAIECYDKALSLDANYDIARHNLDLILKSSVG